MSRLTRILRVLVLALALPALLVPSGWSAHVCLCAAIEASVADDCCSAQAPESDEVELTSCCSVQADSAPESDAQLGQADDCGQAGCEGCCRLVKAEAFELASSSHDTFKFPALALACSTPAWVTPAAAPRRPQALCTRSLAPPRASTPLPLRI